MFYCYLHNWYSVEKKCPACFPMIITSASTELIPEASQSKEWIWTDELVKEFADKCINDEVRPGSVELKSFKQSHQSSIPDSKERIEVEVNILGELRRDAIIKTGGRCIENKHIQLLKEAIERVLNGGDDGTIAIGRREGYELWSDGNYNRLYTKQQMDKARRDAFEAARKKKRDLGEPYFPRYIDKYPTLESYLETLKDK